MEAALSVQGVAFRYGDEPVLESVSLDVERGSFLGLVGPNGSGKTTLLRIAAGLLRPTRGAVLLEGEPLQGMTRTQVARQLALLPQSPDLPPAFTAWELVLMGRTPFLGLLGQEGPSDIAAAERAMEMARCRHLADRRIGELSGGERQRVLMARVLAQQPRVLLLDEPTVHMDLENQVGTVELVSELVAGGVAAIGVFHDLNLAACYCDRLAVLWRGRVVALGTPWETLDSATLSRVFGVPLRLAVHPSEGVPVVLPPGRGRGDAGTRGRGDGETGRRGDTETGRQGDGETGRRGGRGDGETRGGGDGVAGLQQKRL